MANITETDTYDAGVYLLATTDPVQGGTLGASNVPIINLANRTNYLNNRAFGVGQKFQDATIYVLGADAAHAVAVQNTGKKTIFCFLWFKPSSGDVIIRVQSSDTEAFTTTNDYIVACPAGSWTSITVPASYQEWWRAYIDTGSTGTISANTPYVQFS